MTHYFRLYFSIEPVVRARRLAAENEIEMCDDREDCCSGKAYSKNEDLVYDLFNDQDRKSRFVIIVSRSSLQNTRTEGILCWKIYGHFFNCKYNQTVYFQTKDHTLCNQTFWKRIFKDVDCVNLEYGYCSDPFLLYCCGFFPVQCFCRWVRYP